MEIKLTNLDPNRTYTVEIVDNAYKSRNHTKTLEVAGSKGSQATVLLDLGKSHSWYDVSVRIVGLETFEKRYAGRVETGRMGYTDPAMGRVVS